MSILFDSVICWRLTLALLHVSWIGVVIGIIAAIANRILRTHKAVWRYRVDLIAMLALTASLPLTLFFMPINETATVVPTNSLEDVAEFTGAGLKVQQPVVAEMQSSVVTSIDANLPHETTPATRSDLTTAADSTETSGFSNWRGTESFLRQFAPWIAWLYFFGVVLMLAKTARSVRVTHRLRTRSKPVSEIGILTLLRQQSARLGLRFVPEIATCEAVFVPLVVGILRPMILVPASMLSGLTSQQFEAVLLHELAHLHRRDHVVIVLQRVLEALLFFHPVTWYLSRRIQHERECCCDELVVSTGTDRLVYANALLYVAEMRHRNAGTHIGSTGLAASGQRPSSLRRRIVRILSSPDPETIRVTTWPTLVTVTLLIIATSVAVSAVVLPRNDENKPPSDDGPPLAQSATLNSPPLSVPVNANTDGLQDVDGYSLPTGALQKFGSSRFRTGGQAWQTVRFSQNGEWIWCKANGLSVIHRETGHVIRGPQLGIRGMSVTAIAVSTKSNRAVVATVTGRPGNHESSIFIMNSNTGELISRFEGQKGDFFVTGLAISDDGTQILTLGYRDARLWDAESGRELKRIDSGTPLKSAVFSPDGGRIFAVGFGGGQADGSLFWNHAAGTQPVSLDPKVREQISVCASPNGSYFATAAIFEKDGVRLWNGKDGTLIRRLKANGSKGHADGGFCFAPDSKSLFVPATDVNLIEVWDADSGQLQFTLPSKQPRSVCVSPDGKWLAAVGNSQRLSLFDLAARKEATPGTSPHFSNIMAIRFIDSDRLVTVDDDSVTSAWSTKSGKIDWEQVSIVGTFTGAAAVSPDGSQVAINPIGESMQIVDSRTGRKLFQLKSSARYGNSRAAEFTPDGKLLLTWSDSSEVIAWDTKTGSEAFAAAINVPGYIYDASRPIGAPVACFSGQADDLFAGFEDNLYRFDATTGELLAALPSSRIIRIVSSPDGRWLATAESRQRPEKAKTTEYLLQIRDASTLEPVCHLASGEAHYPAFAFSSDSQLLAWENRQEIAGVTVADITAKTIVMQVPNVGSCTSIEFSPDSTHLASGHKDGTAILWDLTRFRLKTPIAIARATDKAGDAGLGARVELSMPTEPAQTVLGQ